MLSPAFRRVLCEAFAHFAVSCVPYPAKRRHQTAKLTKRAEDASGYTFIGNRPGCKMSAQFQTRAKKSSGEKRLASPLNHSKPNRSVHIQFHTVAEVNVF